MDKLQANTTHIATALCIEGKKLWRWYRDVLSGFLEQSSQDELHQYDFQTKVGNGTRLVQVPILKQENIGPNMAIDEKKIGEEMHTVLTNRDSGKIALLASTLKSGELAGLAVHFDLKGFDVKTITRDLSNSYDWFCRQAFPNAEHIADKFHIIKAVLDAHQDVRIRHRQDLLRERRLEHEAHKQAEKLRKQQCAMEEKPYVPRKFKEKETKFANGETALEMLARSRYLLFKFPGEWTATQKERAEIMFEKFPQIRTAYHLACSFRTWYRKENIAKDEKDINTRLTAWYREVEQADIDEMSNVKSLIERHQPFITNYFHNGHTNAIAENING